MLTIIIIAVIAYLLYTNWKKNQGQSGMNNLPPSGNQPNITQQQAPPPNTAQKVQCPNCGGENKAGSYFCIHCGKKI